MNWVMLTVLAAAVGGIFAAPVSAQQNDATQAVKLQSLGKMPPASASRELPRDANSQTQLIGEPGGPSLSAAMGGDVGLVDKNAGPTSVAKARSQ